MNECLLVKWIWKIFQEPDELWFKILKAKYMGENGFIASKVTGGHNSGKVCIRASTCSNGGLCSK